MLQVCLYTRRGCRACDTIGPMLHELRSEFSFELETVDIAQDAELASRFGCSIPVVTIDGGNQVAARITPERLRQALARAQQRRDARDRASSATST